MQRGRLAELDRELVHLSRGDIADRLIKFCGFKLELHEALALFVSPVGKDPVVEKALRELRVPWSAATPGCDGCLRW
jgi:hypothetical protein